MDHSPISTAALRADLLVGLALLRPGIYSYAELAAAAGGGSGLDDALADGWVTLVTEVCVDSDGEPYPDRLVLVDPVAIRARARFLPTTVARLAVEPVPVEVILPGR